MVGKRLRVDGHFSRTGIQTYGDGAGGSTREYRSADEVFADASLRSLQAMPVTVRHPQGVGGQVTPDNWRELAAKGVVVGNSGDSVGKSDDGVHTSGSLWLHDADAIRRVQGGELKELSVGYTAQVEPTPGMTPDGEHYDALQTNILGNHIALLGGGEARGGPTVRILDAAGHVRFDDTDPPKETAPMKRVTIEIDGNAYELEVNDNSDLALAYVRADKLDEVAAATSVLQAKLDAMTEERDGLTKQLDPKALAATAATRVKVLTDAATVAGKDVADEGDLSAIRCAALTARGIDVTDKSDAYLEARFDAALESPKTDAVDKLRGGDPNTKTNAVELTDEQASYTTMSGR